MIEKTCGYEKIGAERLLAFRADSRSINIKDYYFRSIENSGDNRMV